MGSDLSFMLGLYLSTTGASIIMNIYIYTTNHRHGKKDAYRKLKYRKGLSFRTKLHLSIISQEHIYDIVHGFLYSLLPGCNIVFTLSNIEFVNEYDEISKEVYGEIVEEANEIEDNYRKRNVALLKNIKESLKVMPEDINLEDKSTRLSKKETKRILKLNNLDYYSELLKYEEQNN